MILFAGFLGVAMWIAFREEVGMISNDYYEEELKHSQKMDRLENAQALGDGPAISLDTERRIVIEFADFHKIEKGELRVLRPNDPNLDQNFIINPSDKTTQLFELRNRKPGLYRISMIWTMNSQDYQVEQIVIL